MEREHDSGGRKQPTCNKAVEALATLLFLKID